MGRKFANILETVGNTPVVRIGKLAPTDVNLYVKSKPLTRWARSRTGWRSG
jgi:cysteine synthase